MKMKIFALMMLFLLLFGTNTYAFNPEDSYATNFSTIIDSISFSQPIMETDGEYVFLKVNEANMYMRNWSKPMLPVFSKTYELPMGTKINKVECTPNSINQRFIPQKVKPATRVWYLPAVNGMPINDSEIEIVENYSVYSSSNLFPDGWYGYKINCGLNGDKNVIFLTLSFYPIRYSPAENTIHYADRVNVKITYEEPVDPVTFSDEYDMVIITPKKFSRMLQKFVNHKNAHDVKTEIKTTEEIFEEYSGRDKPEQIKYFIKDAKETCNITYVLLIGGLKTYFYAKDKDDCNQGSNAWYVPVRYTNIEEGLENGLISDLYYADLYRYNKSFGKIEFEDWDSNSNNVFAEGKLDYLERMDLCPDVHVGRLPCRNRFEVRTMMNKIINYESTSHVDKKWFKRMVSITGQFFPRKCEETPVGEMYCDVSIDYMSNLIDEPVRVYSSNRETGGPVPVAKDITREISKGAGFVDFEGHGFPYGWNVYWADAEEGNEDAWAGGINNYQLWRLTNGRKLPIAVVAGCHTALFNTTLTTSLFSKRLGYNHWYWTSGVPIVGCLCWRLLAKPRGGAIATIGCTAAESMSSNITYNSIGFSFSCELNYDFFYQIGRNNVTILGEAFSGSICKSIKENPIRRYEAWCITGQQIFCDPSLKMGGYP